MRILICPLDWGMGHTTRMIPVAYRLMKEGHKVVFGGSSRQLALVRSDLPEAGTLLFPGFTTRYSKVLPMYLYTAFRVPAFVAALLREHRRLNRLLKEQHFDMVISDNRMGLWNKDVKTVYVTHMLRIPMPLLLRFLEPPGVWLHRQFINRFDECWIPDEEGGNNLSGRLAHDVRIPSNAKYTGILSKYSICRDDEMVIPGELAAMIDKPWSVLILSGPEPQRSLLRDHIAGSWNKPGRLAGTWSKTGELAGTLSSPGELSNPSSKPGEFADSLSKTGELLVIFEGKSEGPADITRDGSVISVPHLNPAAMAAVVKGSRYIYSRSGYTTIMELASLGRLDNRATLIPTPGQTEQEYLAKLHYPAGAQ